MTRPTVLLLNRLRWLLDQTLDLDAASLDAFLERLARDAPEDARELAALLAAEPELDAAQFLCRASGPVARLGQVRVARF
jgi:hypothetical protein